MEIALRQRHNSDIRVHIEDQKGHAENDAFQNEPSLTREEEIITGEDAILEKVNKKMFCKGDYGAQLIDINVYKGDIVKTLDDATDQKERASSRPTDASNDERNTKDIMEKNEDETLTETSIATGKRMEEIVLSTNTEELLMANVEDVASCEFLDSDITLTHPTDNDAGDALREDDLRKSEEISISTKAETSGQRHYVANSDELVAQLDGCSVNDNAVESVETISDATARLFFEINENETSNEGGAAYSKSDEEELASSGKERTTSTSEKGNNHGARFEDDEESQDDGAATRELAQAENGEHLREGGQAQDKANDSDVDESTQADDLPVSGVVCSTLVLEENGESRVKLVVDPENTSSAITEDLRDGNGEDISEGDDDISSDVRLCVTENSNDRYDELVEGCFSDVNSESTDSLSDVTGIDANDLNGRGKAVSVKKRGVLGTDGYGMQSSRSECPRASGEAEHGATETSGDRHGGVVANTTEGIKNGTMTRDVYASRDANRRIIENYTIPGTLAKKRRSRRNGTDTNTPDRPGEHQREALKSESYVPQVKQRQRNKTSYAGSEMQKRTVLEKNIAKAPQKNLFRWFLDTISCTSETEDTPSERPGKADAKKRKNAARNDVDGIRNNDVSTSTRKTRLNKDKTATKRSDQPTSKMSDLEMRAANTDSTNAKKGASEVPKKGMFQRFLDVIDDAFEFTIPDEVANAEEPNDVAKPKRVHRKSKRGSVCRGEKPSESSSSRDKRNKAKKARERTRQNRIKETDVVKKSSVRRSAQSDANRTFTTETEIDAVGPRSRQIYGTDSHDTTMDGVSGEVTEDNSVHEGRLNSCLNDLSQSDDSLIMDSLSASCVMRSDFVQNSASDNRPSEHFVAEDAEAQSWEPENDSPKNEVQDRSLLDVASISRTRTLSEDHHTAINFVPEDDESENSLAFGRVIQSESITAESCQHYSANGFPEFDANEMRGFLWQQNQMNAMTSSCECERKRGTRIFIDDCFVFDDVPLHEDVLLRPDMANSDETEDEMVEKQEAQDENDADDSSEDYLSRRVCCQINYFEHLPSSTSGDGTGVDGLTGDSASGDDFIEKCAFQSNDAAGHDDLMEEVITKDNLLVNGIVSEANSFAESLSYDHKQKGGIKIANTVQDPAVYSAIGNIDAEGYISINKVDEDCSPVYSAIEDSDAEDYTVINEIDEDYVEQHQTSHEEATSTDLTQNVFSYSGKDSPRHGHSRVDCIASGDKIDDWATQYGMETNTKTHEIEDEDQNTAIITSENGLIY